MKKNQKDGLQYIQDHLLAQTQKSNQFSVDVYQTILKTTEDAEQRTMAVAECAQRQQANLEILAQCVGSEQKERLQITNCLANWSAEVAEKQNLTTTQVTDLQSEIRQLREATQTAFQNTEEQHL